MTDGEGKDIPLDGVAAFDRQDVEFTSAIREGREPESSAESCLPTMRLLDRIDAVMNGHEPSLSNLQSAISNLA
jgi:2-hydroxy-4-carboxymuconate semialdehyde hemiacetal dehydrogenase